MRVIFTVKELPIIRDIQFEGLKSVPESDVLKTFREQRIGVSKEAIYDPVKAHNAKRVIKELLAARGRSERDDRDRRGRGFANFRGAITFVVNEGERVRVVEIQFEGNQIFSDGKLRSQMKYVKEAGLISRFKGQDILDREKLEVRPAPRRSSTCARRAICKRARASRASKAWGGARRVSSSRCRFFPRRTKRCASPSRHRRQALSHRQNEG